MTTQISKLPQTQKTLSDRVEALEFAIDRLECMTVTIGDAETVLKFVKTLQALLGEFQARL